MTAQEGKRAKKRNFTQCEVEILVGELEIREKILFGGHGVGITNARKAEEWQHVADAVNNVASVGRSVAEIKSGGEKAHSPTQEECVCV